MKHASSLVRSALWCTICKVIPTWFMLLIAKIDSVFVACLLTWSLVHSKNQLENQVDFLQGTKVELVFVKELQKPNQFLWLLQKPINL